MYYLSQLKMAKSIKLKNDTYWDARSIEYIANSIVDGTTTRSDLKGRIDNLAGFMATAIPVTGDWNNLPAFNGLYRGSGLSNAPSGTTVANWWFVLQIVHSDANYRKQLAFSFSKDNTSIYSRGKDSNGWGSWKIINASEGVKLFEETANLSTLQSQSTLTLSDSVYNYSYVEIYYCRYGACGKMTKYIPSKMNTVLLDMVMYMNNVSREYTTTLQFSNGTTANLTQKAFANSNGTASVSENNLVVYKIIGYK